MDTFIDKLAQKFTAQEIIRANSAAESNENRKLREQVEAYEDLLQQMKQLNLKNMESAENVSRLIQEGCDNIKNAMENVQTDSVEDKKYVEDLFTQLDDSLHKENVKVYRNVQAVINEQTDALKAKIDEDNQAQIKKIKKQNIFPNTMCIIILVAVLADIALQVLRIFGIL